MIIIIAPGLILVCVLIVALVSLAHLTAGALIAVAAIIAGAGIVTALAVTWMHGRVVPAVEPPRSRLTARAEIVDGSVMEHPRVPVWPSQPVLALSQPLTDEQMRAAARYMLARYQEAEPNQMVKGTDTYWRDAQQADLEGRKEG